MRPKTVSRILGLGSAFPDGVMKNSQFTATAGVSADWISERTGIHERRVLGKNERHSDIAAKAALQAMQRAEIKPGEVDLILGCTNSPDRWMPGLAAIVQHKIGAPKGTVAFDVVSACAGWLVGLQIADSFIKNGTYRNILVLGSEGFSRFLNWKDANSGILFGDASGACLVSAGGEKDGGTILDVQVHTDGSQAGILELFSVDDRLPLGAELKDPASELHLNFDREKVFMQAVRCMASVSEEILARNNLTLGDIDWLVPHQANIWIINTLREKLDFPAEKVAVNIERYGNTLAATIPTCFAEYVEAGKICRGDLVLMTTFGSGATWAASLVRW